MIKAAIFDMDGLLIDSEPFWHQSHIEILGSHGFTITEDDVRAMAGKRTREVVTHWHEKFEWNEPSIDDMTTAVIDNVLEMVRLRGESLPGVEKAIKLFNDHKILMAVASSSRQELIDVVMERLKLDKHMEFAVSAEHEKRGKPFPDIFLTAARLLKAKPQNCLVFEDSLNGVKAAKAAKMKVIAVPEAANLEHPEFKEADLVIPSLEKLTWKQIKSLWA